MACLVVRQSFQHCALNGTYRNVHTFPMPATSPVTIGAAPQVSPDSHITRIKRTIALGRSRPVETNDRRATRSRQMKRPGVASDKQRSTSRKRNKLFKRRSDRSNMIRFRVRSHRSRKSLLAWTISHKRREPAFAPQPVGEFRIAFRGPQLCRPAAARIYYCKPVRLILDERLDVLFVV